VIFTNNNQMPSRWLFAGVYALCSILLQSVVQNSEDTHENNQRDEHFYSLIYSNYTILNIFIVPTHALHYTLKY
jgi:hypothetical protein